MGDCVKVADPEPGKAAGAEIKRTRGGGKLWPDAVKQEAVEASLAPGARVTDVARLYGVHPQQLTRWRRAARDGRLRGDAAKDATTAFAHVEMIESAPPPIVSSTSAPVDDAIEIVVGRIVVRIPGLSSPARIAGIVTALETQA